MNNTFTAEQLVASSRSSFKALENLANSAFAGVEKLVDLNLAASKAMVAESFSHFEAVLGAKDAQELMSLQAGGLQSLAEKSAAYGNHFYAIGSESGAEFSQSVEATIAEMHKGLASLVEKLSRNAPAGTETAVAAFKSALTAGQSAIESAQSSARKALEVAESNLMAATHPAASGTSKKA